MCDYINQNRTAKTPVHLAAYAMWRLNWIHPFFGGNGRTSRAFSYLVLCIGLKFVPPADQKNIPQYIEEDRTPYTEALRAADQAWSEGKLDLSEMEKLLGDLLSLQLVSLFESGRGGHRGRSPGARSDEGARLSDGQFRPSGGRHLRGLFAPGAKLPCRAGRGRTESTGRSHNRRSQERLLVYYRVLFEELLKRAGGNEMNEGKYSTTDFLPGANGDYRAGRRGTAHFGASFCGKGGARSRSRWDPIQIHSWTTLAARRRRPTA